MANAPSTASVPRSARQNGDRRFREPDTDERLLRCFTDKPFQNLPAVARQKADRQPPRSSFPGARTRPVRILHDRENGKSRPSRTGRTCLVTSANGIRHIQRKGCCPIFGLGPKMGVSAVESGCFGNSRDLQSYWLPNPHAARFWYVPGPQWTLRGHSFRYVRPRPMAAIPAGRPSRLPLRRVPYPTSPVVTGCVPDNFKESW